MSILGKKRKRRKLELSCTKNNAPKLTVTMNAAVSGVTNDNSSAI